MSGEMTRIQVYLEPELKEQLESLASELDVSRSELVRQSIRRFLQEGKLNEQDPLLGIIGLSKSGKNDISERHDRYIAGER